jgi:hypothetical protein
MTKKSGHDYERGVLWEQRNSERLDREQERHYPDEPSYIPPMKITSELDPDARPLFRWKDMK